MKKGYRSRPQNFKHLPFEEDVQNQNLHGFYAVTCSLFGARIHPTGETFATYRSSEKALKVNVVTTKAGLQ